MTDTEYLRLAIVQAKQSVVAGGFPAGSVVVKNGQVIGEGMSIGNLLNDPTSHSDIAAIRMACTKLSTTDLTGAVLYSSVEPCLMCLGAGNWSGLEKIVYACPQSKISSAYYGGNYKTADINTTFTKAIPLAYLSECEADALKVIADWEASL